VSPSPLYPAQQIKFKGRSVLCRIRTDLRNFSVPNKDRTYKFVFKIDKFHVSTKELEISKNRLLTVRIGLHVAVRFESAPK
jgi:hypothetical protein